MNAAERVCPECGAAAGEKPFCGNCGRNLSKVDRLPTRQEWDEQRAKQEARSRPPSTPPRTIKLPRWTAVLALLVIGGLTAWFLTRPETETYTVPSEAMEPTLEVGEEITVVTDAYDNSDPELGDIVVFHPPVGAEKSVCAALKPGQIQAMARRDVAQDSGAGDISRTSRREAIEQRIQEIEESAEVRDGSQPCTVPTPEQSDQKFVKRLVALPGDELLIFRGCAIVNGEAPESVNKDSTAERACVVWRDGLTPRQEQLLPDPITILPDHYFMLGDNRGASDDSRIWGPVPREAILGRVEE